MTKRHGLQAIVTFALLAILLAPSNASFKLWGTAEDLWGNKIDLSQLNEGIVVLHPFSTSN
jgi:hypothetical protein